MSHLTAVITQNIPDLDIGSTVSILPQSLTRPELLSLCPTSRQYIARG